MIKEVISVNEFRESLKADLPDLLKRVREEACNQIFQTIERSSQGLIDEVRHTKSFAEIVAAPPVPTFANHGVNRPPKPNPEGVLFIHPKNDKVRVCEENLNIFMNIIKNNIPGARIKNTGSLRGGGVKFKCESTTEAEKLRSDILGFATEDIPINFDLFLPGKKAPPAYPLWSRGGIDEESHLRGLIDKNEGLAETDENGKTTTHIEINFKIPARDGKNNHWVMSINPGKFLELKGRGGLYLYYTRHRTSEFVNDRQCRICGGLGHTSRNCPAPDRPRCQGCGETEVREKHKCSRARCPNCIQQNKKFKTKFGTQLSCRDKKCKSYLKIKDLIISRTDYGYQKSQMYTNQC